MTTVDTPMVFPFSLSVAKAIYIRSPLTTRPGAIFSTPHSRMVVPPVPNESAKCEVLYLQMRFTNTYQLC
jgi:hypothetical protein